METVVTEQGCSVLPCWVPGSCKASHAAAAPRRTQPSSQFCTGLSGFCDDVVHSPCTTPGCTTPGLSGAAGRLYTYPSATATAPTAIFAPRSILTIRKGSRPRGGGL